MKKTNMSVVIVGLVILVFAALIALQNKPVIKEQPKVSFEPTLYEAKTMDASRSVMSGLLLDIKCNSQVKMMSFTIHNPFQIPLKLNPDAIENYGSDGMKLVVNQVKMDVNEMCGKEVLAPGETLACKGTFGNLRTLRNKFVTSDNGQRTSEGGADVSNDIAIFTPEGSQHIKVYCH